MPDDDDNVYLDPSVVRQVIDDLREAVAVRRRPVTRQLLRDSRPRWRCRCGASRYEDLGDHIRCLACGAEHAVSGP